MGSPAGGIALLVLEGPWWTPKDKPKRPSILPFFEGLEKYKGDFNIYYSNFYEKTGFRRALEDDLTHTKEDRLFLYIAAHGYSRMIGGLKSKTGMQISTLLSQVKAVAQNSNIEGVVLGSCNIGINIQDFARTVKGSRICWLFAYTCEIDWVASTLVDVSVFEQMTALPRKDLQSREAIVEGFARALARFNKDYSICNTDGVTTPLSDAITLVVQPRRRGARPVDTRQFLFEKLGWTESGQHPS